MTANRELNNMPVGWRIAELRRRRGWSQSFLAASIGRSKSWVDKVERGVRPLATVVSRQLLANALGVDEQTLSQQIVVQRYRAVHCQLCDTTSTNPRLQHPRECRGRLVRVVVTITLADTEPGGET